MNIDRLAIALSRRRLIGASLFAALQARIVAADHKPSHDPPGQWTETPTLEPTAIETGTPVPTDVPTDIPTETVVPTDVPTETATDEPTVEPTSTDQATPIPADTETATATNTETATSTPTETATTTPTVGPGDPVPVDSVLLRWYKITRSGDAGYDAMRYRPRQCVAGVTVPDPTWGTYAITDAGPYAGYDLLTTPNVGSLRADTQSDWLTVGLNRPARVGIVWRQNWWELPPWLASWERGTDLKVTSERWGNQAYATFWQDVGSGDSVYGAVHAGIGGTPWNTYWLLFAEASGNPSGDPSGITPNAPCPFHPDGWHPQIDPVSWCYYGHEHGTNPASLGVGWTPSFGRAAIAAGHNEPNAGNKGFGWVQNGIRWYVGMHQGTAGTARLCVPRHETALAAWDDASGNLLLDLRWMGHYGAAVSNQTLQCLAVATCPDQCQDSVGSTGVRQVPVIADGLTGYEPWRVDVSGNVLGLVNTMLFNTLDSVTVCDDTGCDLVASGMSGTKRFYQGNGFGVVNPPQTGTFYTDPTATEFRDGSELDSVAQFIAPGITRLTIATNKVFDVDGFGRLCLPSEGDVLNLNPTARESSIGSAN